MGGAYGENVGWFGQSLSHRRLTHNVRYIERNSLKQSEIQRDLIVPFIGNKFRSVEIDETKTE